MAARRGSVMSARLRVEGRSSQAGLTGRAADLTIQTEFSLLSWSGESKVQRVVIVGASLAGSRAAQAARAGGFDGELVVVGEEPHRPYQRPPLSKELLGGGDENPPRPDTPPRLSKELLAGEHESERVMLPADAFDAQWRLGVAATSL